jgi:hypothetical protein
LTEQQDLVLCRTSTDRFFSKTYYENYFSSEKFVYSL